MSEAPRKRLASLDQFRGYTVAGMFLVNFVGRYGEMHHLLKHHTTYCSYADTIMPQFFFAVGFAYRLTFGRRLQTEGAAVAYGRIIRRFLGLGLLAIVLYSAEPVAQNWNDWQNLVQSNGYEALFYKSIKQMWFQTLLHIAVTSLWLLPVIRAGWKVRVLYGVASAILHLVLSHWFYFDWAHISPGTIDGGPLGFLTWSIPTLAGTLACDAFLVEGKPKIAAVFGWGILFMALGWGMSGLTRLYDLPAETTAQLTAESEAIKQMAETNSKESDEKKKEEVAAEIEERTKKLHSGKYASDAVIPDSARWKGKSVTSLVCELPFVPPPDEFHRQRNYWQMSQMDGTISYLVFSTGISLILYVLFYFISDVVGLQIGIFRTLGTNALFGYVIHGIVDSGVSPFFPKDSPLTTAWISFFIYFFICWLFIRTMEKQKIYIRL